MSHKGAWLGQTFSDQFDRFTRLRMEKIVFDIEHGKIYFMNLKRNVSENNVSDEKSYKVASACCRNKPSLLKLWRVFTFKNHFQKAPPAFQNSSRKLPYAKEI